MSQCGCNGHDFNRYFQAEFELLEEYEVAFAEDHDIHPNLVIESGADGTDQPPVTPQPRQQRHAAQREAAAEKKARFEERVEIEKRKENRREEAQRQRQEFRQDFLSLFRDMVSNMKKTEENVIIANLFTFLPE